MNASEPRFIFPIQFPFLTFIRSWSDPIPSRISHPRFSLPLKLLKSLIECLIIAGQDFFSRSFILIRCCIQIYQLLYPDPLIYPDLSDFVFWSAVLSSSAELYPDPLLYPHQLLYPEQLFYPDQLLYLV